jgi:hypothetical protein
LTLFFKKTIANKFFKEYNIIIKLKIIFKKIILIFLKKNKWEISQEGGDNYGYHEKNREESGS